jgi:hypothetical protein
MPEQTEEFFSPEIFVYATNKNFLNFYDALAINKVQITAAQYGDSYVSARVYMDLDDIRLLIHAVTQGWFEGIYPKGLTLFSGSPNKQTGKIESRVLKMTFKEADEKYSASYSIAVENGPGKRGPTGTVMPDGAPTSKVFMRIPAVDLLKVLLQVQAYLNAADVIMFHERNEKNLQKQRDKREERGAD